MATKQRPPKSFRLSEDGERLLETLAAKLGIKQTAVMEIAIRRLASAEGVETPPAKRESGQ